MFDVLTGKHAWEMSCSFIKPKGLEFRPVNFFGSATWRNHICLGEYTLLPHSYSSRGPEEPPWLLVGEVSFGSPHHLPSMCVAFFAFEV